MNFQGKAVLVYLEEDNIARAYFRIQPLLTQDGPVGPVINVYPDDGFLRIVPDKNEQHTFKERMRTMCGLCLMDLRHLPPEANKIRTNKNYAPARGENNQFIIYSDAVQAMPDDLLYQVVGENDVKAASTPFVYIRKGANIQGPFRRENGEPEGDTVQLPPDSTEIHSVTVSGQELLFYWPKKAEPVEEAPQEKAPAQDAPKEEIAPPAPPAPQPMTALEQIQSLNESVSESANLLHAAEEAAPVSFAPEQPAKPLTGTRLYTAPQKGTQPRRAHNPLMEAVENQRYAARYETHYEAPGATIPQNTELKEVANPADALKRALQNMSHSPESQRQAADVLLAQSGMRIMLAKCLAHETNDLTLAAMHSQLQELEAERLMTLMQLDDVKKNLAAAREDALGKLSMAEQKKLDELHAAQQKAKDALEALNSAIEPIERKRQEAAQALESLQGKWENQTDYLCPPAGGEGTKEELIARVEKSMKAAGFILEPGDAQAMLTAFALNERGQVWEIRAESYDDAWQAHLAFAAALGTKALCDFSLENHFAVLPGGSTPLFVANQFVDHPLIVHADVQLIGQAEEKDYWMPPHASVPVYAAPDALPQALPAFPPVSGESIRKAMLTESELTEETTAVIASLRKALSELGKPLPLRAVRMIDRFIAATQNDAKGGVAEAIDRAVCLWAVPHLLEHGIDPEAVKSLLSAMPRTLKALKA